MSKLEAYATEFINIKLHFRHSSSIPVRDLFQQILSGEKRELHVMRGLPLR